MRIYNGSERLHLKNNDDGFRFSPGRPSKDYTNEKAIIANHVSNGYTYAEIADKMGIKRTMVKFIQYHD
jgi:DNA-binding NarL/FixJ family response regulator